jgi:serine/threonine-protein kinase SBK
VTTIDEPFDVVRQLGTGTYGSVLLARCRRTATQVALKVMPKSTVKLRDFVREFQYSYYLSPHHAVINTYDVAFETPTAYVFVQEPALYGDLFEAITPRRGLNESTTKLVVRQIASALDFMHSRSLVHRDIKPENVLIFDDKLTRVKLMDFGLTKPCGTVVRKVSAGIPYTPPDVCATRRGDQYVVLPHNDVWAFGVLLFCMLTGNFPWERAAVGVDAYYADFVAWQRRGGFTDSAPPAQWQRFSGRMLRLFRRLLDARPEKRCQIKAVYKYLDDDWLLSSAGR